MKHLGLVWQLLLLAAALSLNACSSPPASAPSAIRIRWAHDPEALHPLFLPNQNAIDAANLLHLSLLQINPLSKTFEPGLAESFPAVELVGDSLTRLTYQLRPLARWDDGRPVQARDVEFTLKLMYCPGLPNEMSQAQYGFIKSIQLDAQNPRRFTLVCRGQSPAYIISSGDFFILPEGALDPQSQLRQFTLAALQHRSSTQAADSILTQQARRYQAAAPSQHPGLLPGCGPYRLVSWEKDRHLLFQRKSGWWADQLHPTPTVLQALPRQLQFVIIPDDATATLALQRGELEVYPQVPAREFARLQHSASAQKALAFYTAPSYDVVTAGFNTRRPILADALTRRALSHLFNAAGLLKATQLGEGSRTVGLVNPTDHTNYNDLLQLTSFSLANTKALLRQAGWQPGADSTTSWQRTAANGSRQQLALKFRYRTDDIMFETIALQFRAAAAQLGIRVTLLPTESATFSTSLRAGDYDVYVRTLKGNPFSFNFMPILHSQAVGEGNVTGFGTPASDQLIEALAAATTPADKVRLVREFQAMLQQQAPLVPLFFLPARIAASRQIAGLRATGIKPGYSPAFLTYKAAVARAGQ
jgi:ABC-type transport system substrate-binding protein